MSQSRVESNSNNNNSNTIESIKRKSSFSNSVEQRKKKQGSNNDFFYVGEDDYTCVICLSAPLEMALMQCLEGHLYCKECIDQLPKCSMCNQDFTVSKPSRNRLAESIVAQLAVVCPNLNCSVKMKKEGVDDHVKHHCLKAVIPCRFQFMNCGWTSTRAEEPAHQLLCNKRVTEIDTVKKRIAEIQEKESEKLNKRISEMETTEELDKDVMQFLRYPLSSNNTSCTVSCTRNQLKFEMDSKSKSKTEIRIACTIDVDRLFVDLRESHTSNLEFTRKYVIFTTNVMLPLTLFAEVRSKSQSFTKRHVIKLLPSQIESLKTHDLLKFVVYSDG
jgi:hypothetical protein